jgi:hypothetical protein
VPSSYRSMAKPIWNRKGFGVGWSILCQGNRCTLKRWRHWCGLLCRYSSPSLLVRDHRGRRWGRKAAKASTASSRA